MVYLTTAMQSVTSAESVPFNNENPNNSDTVNLVNSGSLAVPYAGLQVTNGGIYQVTWGYQTSTTPATVNLLINNSIMAPPTPPAYQELSTSNNNPAQRFMSSLTTILAIPAGGILTLHPTGTVVFINGGGTTNAVTAYITVFRLQ